jgi:GNAT superfamily N-acetyltransferase
MEVEISSIRNTAFEKIAWDIFFKSKQRGVSFERHFPWILSGNDGVWYLTIKFENNVIGGLVIKEKICSLNGIHFKIGLLGLVCVAREYRGRGIAAIMMQKAIAFVTAKQLDALTLWTGKPEVYIKHGFAINDPWLFGSVSNSSTVTDRLESLDAKNRRRKRLDIALPPFALSIEEYFDDKSTVLTVEDISGRILMEYSGNVNEVTILLAKQMPPKWRINVIKNDPLIEQLKNFGFDIAIKPNNLQMWLCLNKNYAIDAIAEQFIVPPLDRI